MPDGMAALATRLEGLGGHGEHAGKPGAGAAPDCSGVFTNENIRGILEGGFSIIADRSGRAHWRLNASEAVALGTVLASYLRAVVRVSAHLAGGILVAVVSAVVVLPRLWKDADMAKDDKRA
ncbi:MAG: hypothetical protein HYZ75_00830 [Elusimicrobia bacterium]|nr:hypothetical protein [Elusimicrobiota bacterium]